MFPSLVQEDASINQAKHVQFENQRRITQKLEDILMARKIVVKFHWRLKSLGKVDNKPIFPNSHEN